MLFDMLMLFMILSVLFLVITLFIMEEFPMQTIPFIMMGMVFCILSAYGCFDVEYFYVGYNATLGSSTTGIYSTVDYYTPLSYVFMLLFFIYVVLFVKTGANWWTLALQTKGELDFNRRRKR